MTVQALEPELSSADLSAKRSGTKHMFAVWGVRLAIVVGLGVLWQEASGPLIQPILVSKPSDILRQFFTWISDGTLLSNTEVTIRSAAIGFCFGAVAGIVIGYVAGVSKFLASVMEPFVSAGYSVPLLALVPVLIIWVGVGSSLAVTMAGVLVFFLLFYNTYYGIKEVEQALIDSVRIMGGSRWTVATRVELPSALVWILASLKVSIPQAFVGAVAAEILASNAGLGYLLARQAGQFNTTGAFAALLMLLIIGFALNRLVTALSSRALLWKGGQ